MTKFSFDLAKLDLNSFDLFAIVTIKLTLALSLAEISCNVLVLVVFRDFDLQGRELDCLDLNFKILSECDVSHDSFERVSHYFLCRFVVIDVLDIRLNIVFELQNC